MFMMVNTRSSGPVPCFSFDKVCKVKYRVRHLKGQPQYIVVQALWPKVVFTAILFEIWKVQKATIYKPSLQKMSSENW